MGSSEFLSAFSDKKSFLQECTDNSNMPDLIPIDVLLDEIIYLYKVQAALLKSQHEKGATIDEFRQKVQTWVK